MEPSFILPDLEDEEATPFWQGTARGELLMQKCSACGRMRIPPRPMCPHCQSLANEWVRLSGKGRVWSFVMPHPPLLPAYAELAPYNVIAVELDEDPSLRLIGNLVTSADGAINEIDPRAIEIGESVRVVFAKVEDVYLPRWVRDEEKTT
jgi:uncharacterized OB-fold protein